MARKNRGDDPLAWTAAWSGPAKEPTADEVKKASKSLYGEKGLKAALLPESRVSQLSRPGPDGVLSSATDRPNGILTHKAAQAARGILEKVSGDKYFARDTADKLETASEFINPLTWADMAGTSLRRLYDEGGWDNAGQAALDVAGLIPGEHLAAGAALAAKPILGAAPIAAAMGSIKKVLGTADDVAEEMVPFRHFSFDPEISRTDPAKWGSNPNKKFLPSQERNRMGVAPGRTYIGLDSGPKPYVHEKGVGPHEYTGSVPKSRLYPLDEDPLGLYEKARAIPSYKPPGIATDVRDYNGKAYDDTSIIEQMVKDQGYAGFYRDHPELGRSGALFEPWDVQRVHRPLEGLPDKVKVDGVLTQQGPDAKARLAAEKYMRDAGLEYNPPRKYVKADPERGARIAKAFEEMPHAPSDPKVAASYGALSKETLAQYEAAKAAGMKFNFYPEHGDPYGNPRNALADVRDNSNLYVFPTDHGYGSDGITDEMIAENPMLALIPGETWDGKPVRVNDAFRAIHDFYGHAKEGVGFRASGEENAWRAHASMFSLDALPAMTAETRGQNSWVNFGPHGEANRSASAEGTVYAPQKIGIMPDWAINEGAEDFLKTPIAAEMQAEARRKKIVEEMRSEPSYGPTAKRQDGTSWRKNHNTGQFEQVFD